MKRLLENIFIGPIALLWVFALWLTSDTPPYL